MTSPPHGGLAPVDATWPQLRDMPSPPHVPCLRDLGWTTNRLPPPFLSSVVQDPQAWSLLECGNVALFVRGDAWLILDDTEAEFVAHGTALYNTHLIFIEGLRAGSGTHTNRHGWFAMGAGRTKDRITHARHRSSVQEPEFDRHRWPSSWTCPTVLVWRRDNNDWPFRSIQALHDGCCKMWVQTREGTVRHLPQAVGIVFNWQELQRYTMLQLDFEVLNGGHMMICGGYQRRGRTDMLYWTSRRNNMPASCGRTCSISTLLEEGWRRTTGASIWFCPQCLDNGCKPSLWNRTHMLDRL